jgi:hypothetical protein
VVQAPPPFAAPVAINLADTVPNSVNLYNIGRSPHYGHYGYINPPVVSRGPQAPALFKTQSKGVIVLPPPGSSSVMDIQSKFNSVELSQKKISASLHNILKPDSFRLPTEKNNTLPGGPFKYPAF